jgi:trehalose 6-phosphate phosphatase
MRVIRRLCNEVESVCARLSDADRVLIALDYDGTLAPIVGTPDEAELPPETMDVLRELASSDRYSVAVVSGRSLVDLKRKLSLDVTYVGNHGLEIEGPGLSYVHPRAEVARTAIDQACWDLEAALGGIRGVAIERKDLSATVHYRQAPADLASWIEATVNAAVRPYLSKIFVGPAHHAWEIRPRLHWNKGSAVRLLLERLGAVTALVCAGDDATDEDMFDIRHCEISIKVGSPRNTRARYYVEDIGELADFLTVLEREESMPSQAYPDSSALPGLQLLG